MAGDAPLGRFGFGFGFGIAGLAGFIAVSVSFRHKARHFPQRGVVFDD